MDNEPMYIFAYGSNMNPDRMLERDVKFDSSELGQLLHYRFRNNKISKNFKTEGFANIEPCFEACVFGILYTLSPDADLSVLDRKEGYPHHYQKIYVPINTKNGIVLSLVYIATRLWSTEHDLVMPDKYASLINDGLGKCEDHLKPDDKLYEMFLHYGESITSMIRRK